MHSTERVKQFLVARRKTDGLFLGLRESRNCTSPFYSEYVSDAKRVHPYKTGDLSTPKEPSYYFENSPRAKRWVEDCEMVGYEVVEIATYEELI